METSSSDDKTFQLNLLFKNIQSSERPVRQKALTTLQEQFIENVQTEIEAIDLFAQSYLYLFKCYADKFETCRNLAITAVTNLLDILPDNDYYAECIVPVIAKRVGQTEIIEDSEEIRYLLLQQLLKIIQKFAATESSKDRLLTCYNDIMDILVKTIRDPYAVVQRKCCSIIKQLADATPSFHCRAENLVSPLIGMLGHRHSPNRIAAIEALGKSL